MRKVIKHIHSLSKDHEIWNYIVLHAQNDKAAEWYAKKMVELTGKLAVGIVNISPVIGSNAGLGAVSVALMLN